MSNIRLTNLPLGCQYLQNVDSPRLWGCFMCDEVAAWESIYQDVFCPQCGYRAIRVITLPDIN